MARDRRQHHALRLVGGEGAKGLGSAGVAGSVGVARMARQHDAIDERD